MISAFFTKQADPSSNRAAAAEIASSCLLSAFFLLLCGAHPHEAAASLFSEYLSLLDHLMLIPTSLNHTVGHTDITPTYTHRVTRELELALYNK